MTTNMATLIEDAKAAGFTIKVDVDGHVTIFKTVGRWKKRVGLGIYSDGTAFDLTVSGECAKGLRAYKDMRAILGIY